MTITLAMKIMLKVFLSFPNYDYSFVDIFHMPIMKKQLLMILIYQNVEKLITTCRAVEPSRS